MKDVTYVVVVTDADGTTHVYGAAASEGPEPFHSRGAAIVAAACFHDDVRQIRPLEGL